MKIRPSHSLILLMLQLWVANIAPAQQPPGAAGPAAGPRPPSAAVVDALLAAVATGTSAAAEDFFHEHTTAAYRADTPLDRHLAEFAAMHRALGRAEVLNLVRHPWGEREAQLISGTDGERYVLHLEMMDEAPYRVERLRWRREQLTGSLDAEARSEVLARLHALLEGAYVSPDTARLITAHLHAREAAGAYAHLTEREELAAALTRDLQTIHGDRHLYVRDATGAGAAQGGAAIGNGPPPATAGGAAALGFTRVERLEGNVGYVEIAGPMLTRPGQEARERELVADVVRSLADADVVILDLRASPGGSAQLVNLLVSHFLPPDVHLLTVDAPALGTPSVRRTLASVPGPRLLRVPLYVLTSERTFSAGEDLAFSLASQGRATLVGERTAGGGRNNVPFRIAHGLTASISVSRVLDPRTGQEAWERVGVAPHVETPAAAALEAALRHAGKM